MYKALKNEHFENSRNQNSVFLKGNYFIQTQNVDMSSTFGADYKWEIESNFPLAKGPNHFIGLTMQISSKSSLMTILTKPESEIGKKVLEKFTEMAPRKKEDPLVSGLVYAVLLLAKSKLPPLESEIALEVKRRIGIVPRPLLPDLAEKYLREHDTFLKSKTDICSVVTCNKNIVYTSLGFVLGESTFGSGMHYPANLTEAYRINYIKDKYPIAIQTLIKLLNSINPEDMIDDFKLPPNPPVKIRFYQTSEGDQGVDVIHEPRK